MAQTRFGTGSLPYNAVVEQVHPAFCGVGSALCILQPIIGRRRLRARGKIGAAVGRAGGRQHVKPVLKRRENGQQVFTRRPEIEVSDKPKVLILGGGPNRIGQGIEFDYCCCHASFALRDAGITAIMVNSNPETVSTDYDTSDRLYFEPLTFEDVMNIVEKERPDGVIVQFGGQTPLNLAVPLMRAGVPIMGTSPDAIDRAEDRERFQALIEKLGLLQPPNGTAMDLEERSEERRVGKECGS